VKLGQNVLQFSNFGDRRLDSRTARLEAAAQEQELARKPAILGLHPELLQLFECTDRRGMRHPPVGLARIHRLPERGATVVFSCQ
jgi:hypothetical protein